MIVLSAGHHMLAQGAVNKKSGITEWAAASEVVSRASTLLTSLEMKNTVVKGRLREKVSAVNSHPDATLALDIHFNADCDHLDPNDLDNTRGRGCMVMYAPPEKSFSDPRKDTIRRRQAQAMSSAIATVLGNPDRGGRAGWYWGGVGNGIPSKKDYFLTRTMCAAFIPELGYIDNNGFAEEYLNDIGYQILAEGVVAGIRSFFAYQA